jgi:hypothetical protein
MFSDTPLGNAWYLHVARRLGWAALKWVPLVVLPLLVWLLVALLKESRAVWRRLLDTAKPFRNSPRHFP